VLNAPASHSHGEASIRTCTRLMLFCGWPFILSRMDCSLSGRGENLFKPIAFVKREVVNITVPMAREPPPLPPPPPPELFPIPFARQRSTGRTQNAAGTSAYLQAGPPPGNNRPVPSEFS